MCIYHIIIVLSYIIIYYRVCIIKTTVFSYFVFLLKVLFSTRSRLHLYMRASGEGGKGGREGQGAFFCRYHGNDDVMCAGHVPQVA